jgi:hypothetical protein
MLSQALAYWKSLFSSVLASLGAFSNQQAPANENRHPGWAVVSEVKGAVRHKRSHSSAWLLSKVGTKLFPGDKVYIEENAQVLVRYPKLKASVFASTPSMFTIERDLFHMRHQDRLFALYGLLGNEEKKTEGSPEKEKHEPRHDEFLKAIERPGDRESLIKDSASKLEKTTKEDPKLQQLSFNLTEDDTKGNSRNLKFETGVFSFVREVQLLNWVFPRAKLELVSKKFPTRVNVEVTNIATSPILIGYLWNSKRRTPIWSGVSVGKFNNVPIPAPGSYRLQVISEDNTAASDHIVINASKPGESKFIPSEWEDGETRWIDE